MGGHRAVSAAGEGPLLPRLLAAPLQRLLQRGVARSTSAAALCADLEGRSLQLHAGTDALSAYFSVCDGQLELHPGIHPEPDATLSGSPLALLAMAGAEPDATVRAGRVRLSGNSDVAAAFQDLLGFIRPDPEEELASVAGDTVAYGVGEAARAALGWTRHTTRSLSRSAAEYLMHESRAVVTGPEIEEFCAEVDTLVMTADRCEARLQLLRSQLLSDPEAS